MCLFPGLIILQNIDMLKAEYFSASSKCCRSSIYVDKACFCFVVFLPGDRFVCVAGTPPSITEEKLLDILPGYSATVCLDKAEQHTG